MMEFCSSASLVRRIIAEVLAAVRARMSTSFRSTSSKASVTSRERALPWAEEREEEADRIGGSVALKMTAMLTRSNMLQRAALLLCAMVALRRMLEVVWPM